MPRRQDLIADEPIISSERLILRPGSPQDASEIIRYYRENREHLAPHEPSRREDFYSEAFWHEQVAVRLEEIKNGSSLRLLLFRRRDASRLIGVVNLGRFIRGVRHSCQLDYSLAETMQGQGYMSEILPMVIRFAFEELNFHRIDAAYMPQNIRCGNLLKKLDFAIEGYVRDYALINDRWEDHLLASRLNPNWKEAHDDGE